MPERDRSGQLNEKPGVKRLNDDAAGYMLAMRAPSAEFEQSDLSAFAALEISPSDLVSIVNTAIRVGRGTETLKNLAAMLEPYGVRRKR